MNENDTVAVEEIRFGDNDRLSALVAHARRGRPARRPDRRRRASTRATRASIPRPRWCDVARADDDGVLAAAGPSRSGVGTGGMATKVEAALIAAHAGVPVVVTSTAQAAAALAGEQVGTLFTAHGPASQRPPVLAALRQPPAGPAAPRRGRGRGGPGAARLAAGGRASPACAGRLPRRRPGRAGRPGRRRRRARAGRLRRPRAARRCSAARPATSRRSTGARWCTATRWCWSGARAHGLRDCSA